MDSTAGLCKLVCFWDQEIRGILLLSCNCLMTTQVEACFLQCKEFECFPCSLFYFWVFQLSAFSESIVFFLLLNWLGFILVEKLRILQNLIVVRVVINILLFILI